VDPLREEGVKCGADVDRGFGGRRDPLHELVVGYGEDFGEVGVKALAAG